MTPTVAIYGTLFPRAPADVNIFVEHMWIGQILQPLVEATIDGVTKPGVAESWSISPDGLRYEFKIARNAKFSDGRRVTPNDVITTYQRHLASANSQSKSTLGRIATMTSNNDRLILTLNEPYPALLRALSRDHLGIVPADWKLDPTSTEPFVGSGAYRTIKKQNHWHLIANEHSPNPAPIREWKVLTEPSSETPDLRPLGTHADCSALAASNGGVVEPIQGYGQNSTWWNPHGATVSNQARQSRGMRAMRDLIETQETKQKLATGVIAEGIPGHLKYRPAAGQISRAKETETFEIETSPAIFKLFEDALPAIEKAHNVKFRLHTGGNNASSPPDILFFGYAGGFCDPEGFLTVITAMLEADLKQIFGPLYEQYRQASREPDSENRTILYENFTHALIEQSVMTPGWTSPNFRYRAANLEPREADPRYTPRLQNYAFSKLL